MIPVGSLVGIIPTSEVTIRSYGATTINAFGETEQTPSDSTQTVVVHPSGSDVLERLPEADRHRATISVYSNDTLSTVTSTRPYQVFYQNRWYEVIDSADYNTMGDIYVTIAQLIEEDIAAP